MAKTLIKRLILSVLLIILICAPLPLNLTSNAGAESVKTGEIQTYSGVYGEIEEYLRGAAHKAHIPALSAIIVDKDEVLMSLSVGECTTDTPFLLGSVSKSFTALCIKKLAEEGKIDIDEKISKYLPNATDGDKITVLRLLNHTSGLGEHQTLKNYKIIGERGRHVYANVNYSLLGKIIESVSGKSYSDYVSENIFKPLNLSKTSATKEDSKRAGLVQDYRNIFGFNAPSEPRYPTDEGGWIQPAAGYLSSSANDMGKYLQMYLRGGVAEDGSRIISNDGIDDMFYNGVEVAASIPYKYAMGWTLINESLPEPALRHSGLVETGMSCMYVLPESGIGIAVLVNYNDYFVGQDMMDRLNWSCVLKLLDMGVNEIGDNEFVLKHLMYDAIYFAVFAVAALELALLGVFKKRVYGGKTVTEIILFLIFNIAFPTILLLIPLMLSTPLWVVSAFVPDMFWTIIASASLLYLGGIARLIIFIKSKRSKK